MFFRGIKNRVFIHYWILLFMAMLLVDLLLFSFFFSRSIRQQAEATQRRLTDLCALYALELGPPSEIGRKGADERIAPGERFIFMARGAQSTNGGGALAGLVADTLVSGSAESRNRGKAMGLLFPRAEYLMVSRPVRHNGNVVAAGGIQIRLSPLYENYRKLHTISLIFIFINSFFFALFANRQLGRIYFRPLSRLARRAESYQDEETLFFSVRKEDNEFSILSSSLNKMVNRIRENKRALTETISSLQTANRELKQAQQDVIRAEKLATVGRLTSGIAHEIGNPIGIVLGYLDLLRQDDLDDDDRQDFIRRSEDEITRINGIIRQLLDMSRTSSGEYKAVSIHPLLQELIGIFKYQPYAGDIVFQAQFESISDQVFADSDQLRQVFLNIMLNAVDAVSTIRGRSPRIVLSTRHVIPDDKVSAGPAMIRVGIRDNGPGIGGEHIDRIFDPFFTTKAPGKGTGLGLSVSYMIVEKLGGQLTAVSTEPAGTEFIVTLPLLTAHTHAEQV